LPLEVEARYLLYHYEGTLLNVKILGIITFFIKYS